MTLNHVHYFFMPHERISRRSTISHLFCIIFSIYRVQSLTKYISNFDSNPINNFIVPCPKPIEISWLVSQLRNKLTYWNRQWIKKKSTTFHFFNHTRAYKKHLHFFFFFKNIDKLFHIFYSYILIVIKYQLKTKLNIINIKSTYPSIISNEFKIFQNP